MELKSDFSSLIGKTMFETQDWSDEDLEKTLELASIFQELDMKGIDVPFMKNKLALALFFDKSTRTKASFAGAAARLGAAVEIVDGSTTQVSHGETAEETGAMISMNAHVLGVRHDKIIGEGNSFMRSCIKGSNEYLESIGTKNRMGFINCQCDIDHPTQSMADLMKIKETFPEGLKGKKITISWAYSPSYAKPLSVPQGLITLLTRFGMEVTLAHPSEYKLMDKCMKDAEQNAQRTGGNFKVVHDMKQSFEGADIVYPKSWGPYDLMLKRVEANKKGDTAQLNAIEKEMLEMNAKYKDWICNEEKMAVTNNAHYMHCLPADLGDEVTLEIYNKHKKFMYLQANKKMYIMMALIASNQVSNLHEKLKALM